MSSIPILIGIGFCVVSIIVIALIYFLKPFCPNFGYKCSESTSGSCSGHSRLVSGSCVNCVLPSGNYWTSSSGCDSSPWTSCSAGNTLTGNTITNPGTCVATSCSSHSRLVSGSCVDCVLPSGNYWTSSSGCDSSPWTSCSADTPTTGYTLTGNTSTNPGTCVATCKAGRGTIGSDNVCSRNCGILSPNEFWTDSTTCSQQIFTNITNCNAPSNSTATITSGYTGNDVTAGSDSICGFTCNSGYSIVGGSCVSNSSSGPAQNSSSGPAQCTQYQRWNSQNSYCADLVTGKYWTSSSGTAQSPFISQSDCPSTSTSNFTAIPGSPGTQTTAGNAGYCSTSSCNGNYSLSGGSCVACPLPGASYFNSSSGCDFTTCTGGNRPNGRICQAPNNGQYWTSSSGLTTSPITSSCPNSVSTNYTISGSSVGTPTAAGSAGTCVVSSCNGRNQLSGGTCVSCAPLGASSYWTGSSGCSSQTFKTTADCNVPSDSTATIITIGSQGNDVTAGSDSICGFTCNPGYTNSGTNCIFNTITFTSSTSGPNPPTSGQVSASTTGSAPNYGVSSGIIRWIPAVSRNYTFNLTGGGGGGAAATSSGYNAQNITMSMYIAANTPVYMVIGHGGGTGISSQTSGGGGGGGTFVFVTNGTITNQAPSLNLASNVVAVISAAGGRGGYNASFISGYVVPPVASSATTFSSTSMNVTINRFQTNTTNCAPSTGTYPATGTAGGIYGLSCGSYGAFTNGSFVGSDGIYGGGYGGFGGAAGGAAFFGGPASGLCAQPPLFTDAINGGSTEIYALSGYGFPMSGVPSAGTTGYPGSATVTSASSGTPGAGGVPGSNGANGQIVIS